MMSNQIRIAIVGPVSAGKSTVLNSLFVEQYSDMKIRRTTMLPQVYTETNEGTNNMDPNQISKNNTEANNQIINKHVELTEDNCVEIPYNVPRVFDLIDLHSNTFLEIYDLPGLDDGETEHIYFNYLKNNFKKMDIILFVINIEEALNTSGSRRILDEIVNNVKKNPHLPKHLCVLINKCDDMDENHNFEDDEFEEMFSQAKGVIDEKINGISNLKTTIVKYCAQDAYIYRTFKKNSKAVLDMKNKTKFGVNEVGKNKWKMMTDREKDSTVINYLKKGDYQARMKICGFSELKRVINELVLNDSAQGDYILSHKLEPIKEYYGKQHLDEIDNLKLVEIIDNSNIFYQSIMLIMNQFSIDKHQIVELIKTNLYSFVNTYINEITTQTALPEIEIDYNMVNKIKNNLLELEQKIDKCISTTEIIILFQDKYNEINSNQSHYLLNQIQNNDTLYQSEQYLHNFPQLKIYINYLLENKSNLEIPDIVWKNILKYTPKLLFIGENDSNPIIDFSEFLLEKFNTEYFEQIITYYNQWLNKKLMDYDWFVSFNTNIKKEDLPSNKGMSGSGSGTIFNIFGNTTNDYKLHIQSEILLTDEGARNIALYIDKSNLSFVFPEYFKDYHECESEPQVLQHINNNRIYYCKLVFHLNMVYYNLINYMSTSKMSKYKKEIINQMRLNNSIDRFYSINMDCNLISPIIKSGIFNQIQLNNMEQLRNSTQLNCFIENLVSTDLNYLDILLSN